jgi:hypothetical protein
MTSVMQPAGIVPIDTMVATQMVVGLVCTKVVMVDVVAQLQRILLQLMAWLSKLDVTAKALIC